MTVNPRVFTADTAGNPPPELLGLLDIRTQAAIAAALQGVNVPSPGSIGADPAGAAAAAQAAAIAAAAADATAKIPTAATLSGATTVGRNLLIAPDAGTARTAIGAEVAGAASSLTAAAVTAAAADASTKATAAQVAAVAAAAADATSKASAAQTTAISAAAASTQSQVSALFNGHRTGFGGDSITAGTGATSAAYDYVNQSVRIGGSARITMTVNGGVAGERSDQLLTRVPGIIAAGIEHMHVQIGTNDAGQAVPLTIYQANIIAIVTLCRAAGVSVSMGTVPPRSNVAATSVHVTTHTYNLWLRSWCAKQGIPLADVFSALVDPLTGFYQTAYDCGDGTHPSNAGHLAMAKVVAPVIIARQIVAPWPVASTSPIGLLANPCMNGTTGWADQGGTATASASILAPTVGDGLPAGNWLSYRINNTGGSSLNRQIAATLDSTKYSAGDVLAAFVMVNHTDTTGAVSCKIQVTNGGTAFAIPLDTANSVNNPGPILFQFTVPASPGTLKLGMVLAVPAGIDVTAFLGCVQIFNLTSGGLNGAV